MLSLGNVWKIGVLSIGVVAAQAAAAQSAPQIDFSQATWPMAQVTDSVVVDFLMFELFIEPLQRPDRVHIVDVTRNGFGPDDLLIAYPSVEVFLIPEFVPDSVQSLMSAWRPEVDYRMDSGNMTSATLEALVTRDEEGRGRGESVILHDIVEAIERSYRDLPVAMLFERDSIGFTFQIWDYNREAIRYAPLPSTVSDSALTSVLSMLEDVGYVPGENRARLGVSLESQGTPVATADRALLGILGMADGQPRGLAVRTILLGSYDKDRSGGIDSAYEIDALSCDVWNTLDAGYPNFLENLGFDDPTAPYLGAITLRIASNVRESASRRARACFAGEDPPATDPAEVSAPPDVVLPASVQRHFELTAAADITRAAETHVVGSVQWSGMVRAILVDRFDDDESGLLDAPTEIDAVPCEAWRALESTNVNVLADFGFSGSSYSGEAIGIAEAQRNEVLSTYSVCGASDETTRAVAVRRPPGHTTELPSSAIRDMVTIPLRSLGAVPGEESRRLPAKTIMLAMFDLDRSGAVDRASELDAIPCEVWSALDVTFPSFAERFGFLPGGSNAPYSGDMLLTVTPRLREPAGRRIAACRDGRNPPATMVDGPQPDLSVELSLPVTLADFLELQAAAAIARSSTSLEPGSAASLSLIRSVLTGYYDLDASGAIDTSEELRAVPCVVWTTVEATLGIGLSDDRSSEVESVPASLGIRRESWADAQAIIGRCGH